MLKTFEAHPRGGSSGDVSLFRDAIVTVAPQHREEQSGPANDLVVTWFTGRYDGRELDVIFDYLDDPVHARLLVDGEGRGNRGNPAWGDQPGRRRVRHRGWRP